MLKACGSILRQNAGQIRPGDVFMMNNPYNGGTHLPDVTVITPVFDEDGHAYHLSRSPVVGTMLTLVAKRRDLPRLTAEPSKTKAC